MHCPHRLLLMALALSVTLGCSRLPAAPEDIDNLAHYFFSGLDQNADDAMVSGGENLRTWFLTESPELEPISGALSKMTDDDLLSIELPLSISQRKLYGVFELRHHPECSVDDMRRIYAYNDQQKLQPGKYVEYERTYYEGYPCFEDGACDWIDYDLNVVAKQLTTKFSYLMRNQMAVFRNKDGEEMLFAKGWLPEPADFPSGSPASFDQSYLIDVSIPHPSGGVIRLYGLWNAGGAGLGLGAAFWEQSYLDGVVDWNNRVDELCGRDRNLWQTMPPAPHQLDELLHNLFADFESDEATLSTHADELTAWFTAEHPNSTSSRGSVTAMRESSVSSLGVIDEEADFVDVFGVYELHHHRSCSVEDVRAIYAFDDQAKLFPGVYEAYTRTYLAGQLCFRAGTCTLLDYELALLDSVMGTQLAYTVRTQMRAPGTPETPSRFLTSRSWMINPAQLHGTMLAFLDESYSLELFSPHPDGGVVHVHALWELSGAAIPSLSASFWEQLYLNTLATWNTRLDALCTTERGLWESQGR